MKKAEKYCTNERTTTGKTMALTLRIFVGKVMLMLFNMLSRFVIAFLKEKVSFSSWLQSLGVIQESAVIWEPSKIKICHCFHFGPSICHQVMEPDAMIFFFFFNVVSSQFFSLLFHLHQEVLQLLFTFCHYSSTICIFEVVDISSSNLNYSL